MSVSIIKYKINSHDYLHIQGSLYCTTCSLFKLPALFFHAAFVCRMQICWCIYGNNEKCVQTSVSIEWLRNKGRHKETISQGEV